MFKTEILPIQPHMCSEFLRVWSHDAVTWDVDRDVPIALKLLLVDLNAQTTLFLNSNSLKIIESLKLSSLEQRQSKTFF